VIDLLDPRHVLSSSFCLVKTREHADYNIDNLILGGFPLARKLSRKFQIATPWNVQPLGGGRRRR